MDNSDYVYEKSTRRPAVGFALLLSIGFIYFGFSNGAPWFALAPAWICLLMCVWALIANKISGCSFQGDVLNLYSETWQRQLKSSDINSIIVTNWSDGAPTLKLALCTGETLIIPSMCVGSSKDFIHAFATRNIEAINTN